MKTTISKLAFLLIGAAAFLTGCASQKASVYQTGSVQQQMKVKLATVIDVREVEIEAKSTGTGATAGAAAGAVIGAGGTGPLPMNSSKSGIVTAVAGAVVGGVVGGVAEKIASGKKGQEIIYRIDGSQDTMALVQELDDDPLRPGDRVRLIEGSFAARLVKIGGGKS